jgi:hypothetical protein
MRLLVVVGVLIFTAVNAAALPYRNKNLASVPVDAAIALDADHVSYEPSDRDSTVDLNERADLLPDPYQLELICAKGCIDNFMSFTSDCRHVFHFQCDENGHMTFRDADEDCEQNRACIVSTLLTTYFSAQLAYTDCSHPGMV